MHKKPLQILSVLMTVVLVSGCATTRPRKPAEDPSAQIAALQSEIQAKDQQIQELQTQLDSQSRAMEPVNYASRAGSGKSKYIRVSGVSVADVQRALAKAGYDPGPVDGQMGKKTKSAIKAFQRDKGLTADGIVGERTWSQLK